MPGIWKNPHLQQLSADGRLRAWTGGSTPVPLSQVSAAERRTVTAFFREQLSDWASAWSDCPPADVMRTFWRRARFDAHATHRA